MIITSEAALWLVLLFLFLEEVPGRSPSPRIYNNDTPKSRRTWCEATNTCARCEGRNRPRCSGGAEPVLGADLCECCFSCIAARDLGESCGSQLAMWPDVLGSDPTPSSVTILATTWCREGLVCANFACLDSSSNSQPETFRWSKLDEESVESVDRHGSYAFGPGMISIDTELHGRTTTSTWDPILESENDANFERTDASTPIAPTQSAIPLFTESAQKPQPCYARSEETTTISSYPSDDLLGGVSTVDLNNNRFQLVYAGDLISELKVLLDFVDTCHGDSLLKEGAANSLADAFVGSLSLPDDTDYDGIPLSYEDYVEVLTSSQETGTSSNPYNLTYPRAREKRDLEMMEDDDMVGFDAPGNIQEILIRGASAHKEYFYGGRGREQSTNAPNKSTSDIPAEASSQEDESTVRVHITNRPRKVQTLIDLEEDDEEEGEIGDEEHRGLQSAGRGRAKAAGRLSPLAEEQNGVSPGVPKPLGRTVTTEQTAVTEKTAESRPTGIPQSINSPWNDTLSAFNDRLTLVELRISVFERVLEEIAKWCNLGVFSMTRDCLLAQKSDTRYGRWGSDTDEHLAVASGIDVVRTRENERRLNGNAPRRDGFHDTTIPDVAKLHGIIATPRMSHRGRNEPINRNIHRTITDSDYPRRSKNFGYRESRKRIKSPCRIHDNRDSSRRRPISEAMSHSPAHRTVQRSIVSPMNPFSRNFSRASRPENIDRIATSDQVETVSFRAEQETQIPVPATLAKKMLTLGDIEEQKLSPHEDVSLLERDSTAEITESSGIPSWRIFGLGEDEEGNEDDRSSFRRMTSGLSRIQRSVKQVEGTLPHYEKLRKIRAGLSVPTRGNEELFEEEIAARKEPESNTNRNTRRKVSIAGNGEGRQVSGPLIVDGNREFRNLPEPIANRLLFRISNPPQTAGSTTAVIPTILQDDQKLFDPRLVIDTITNHGNSTIRIEEISEEEYGDSLPQIPNSSTVEDDFDHLYEGVEVVDDDGDFEYDVVYDQVEHVDGSSVEIVTEVPVGGLRTPEIGSKSDLKLSRDRVRSVLFPRFRSRRIPRPEDDRCESARSRTKRDSPLLWFGSTEKHEPKTIVRPSERIGYRKDGLRAGGSKNQGNTINFGFN